MKEINPALQLFHIGRDVIRLMGVDRAGALLDEGAGIGIDMLLKLVDLHDGVMRTDGEAEPPAGHGVGLAEAVGHNQAVTDLRIARKADLGLTGVDQLLIHLIGDNPRVIFQRERHQQVDFLSGKDLAGGIVRVVEEDALCLRVHRGAELLRIKPEVPVKGDVHDLCLRLSQLHHGGIAHIIRREQNHLIARLQQGAEGKEHRRLDARGHDDIRRAVFGREAGVHVFCDQFTKLRQALGGGIMRKARVHRFRGRVQNILRRPEVRFPEPQGNNLPPVRPHFRRSLGELIGQRFSDFLGKNHDSVSPFAAFFASCSSFFRISSNLPQGTALPT